MTPPEPASSALQEHLEICSQLHQFLLEENRVLRAEGTPPGEEMLERKRAFLPRLDASLERLRSINAEGARLSPSERAAVLDGRKRLMQLLMLDRENERLLLKASLPAQWKAALAAVTPGQVARAYQKHASPGTGQPPAGAEPDRRV